MSTSADAGRMRRRYLLGVLVPISITAFSQFQFVQTSRCVLADLPWGVGRCDVIAAQLA